MRGINRNESVKKGRGKNAINGKSKILLWNRGIRKGFSLRNCWNVFNVLFYGCNRTGSRRRKTIGQFSVSVKREKLTALDEKLKEKGQTKTEWLNEKIDEEIRK